MLNECTRGGPGDSGVQNILGLGPLAQTIVGANYDLISFDPRGVGECHISFQKIPKCLKV